VFTGVQVESFPTRPQLLDIFAVLTNGQGDVTISLSVTHLETNEEVYSQRVTVGFRHPLQIVNLRYRVRHLIYDVAGTYLFALTVDGEEIAARRVSVYEVGGES
jgi:hypothetical protein